MLRRHGIPGLIVCWSLIGIQAWAATIKWSGASTSNSNWSLKRNWSTGSAPGNNNDLFWDATYSMARPASIVDSGFGATTENSLTVDSGFSISVQKSLTINSPNTALTLTRTGGTTVAANTIAGTIDVPTAGVTLTYTPSASRPGSVTGTGVLSTHGGTLTLGGPWNNAAAGTIQNVSGTINVAAGAVITSGTFRGAITNSGTLRGVTVASDGVITGGTILGTTSNSGRLNGTLIGDSGTTATTVTGGTIGGTTSLRTATVSGAANTGTVTATQGTDTWTGGSNSGTMITAAGATLNIGGALNNTGGIINRGAGTLSISSGATVTGGTLTGAISNGGTLSGTTLGNNGTTATTITGGNLTAATSLLTATVSGEANDGTVTAAQGADTWTGGSNSGTLTTASGATLSITGNVNNAGGIIDRGAGTLNIGPGAIVTGGTVTGTIANSGTLSGTTLGNSGAIATTITGGTLTGTTSLQTATVNGAANSGTVTAAQGANTWIGGSNTGTLTTATSSSLAIAGTLNNTSGTVNGGPGTLTISSGATVTGGTVSGTLGASGATLSGTTLRDVALNGGTLTGTGSATGNNSLSGLTNGGTLNVTSGISTFLGTTTNAAGIISVQGGSLILNGSSSAALNGGTVTMASGIVRVEPGSSFRPDIYTQSGGALTLNSSLGSASLAAITFTGGTVADGVGPAAFGSGATVVNQGVDLSPGGSQTRATWSFTKYVQNLDGSLTLDVYGLTDHDQINLTGPASLGGDLIIVWGPNGPALGQAYHDKIPLLTALGGVSGVFDTVTIQNNSASLPYYWRILYEPNQVSLYYDVPEPSTGLLMLGGLLAAVMAGRKQFRQG